MSGRFFNKTLNGLTSSVTKMLNSSEEGLWTPTIEDTSGGDEGQTYSVQSGSYTRIGNRIFITGKLIITGFGTLTTSEQAFISGLPFISQSAAHSEGPITIWGTNLSITATANLIGLILEGTSKFKIYDWDAATGVSNTLLSEITSNATLIFNGQYVI